MPRQMFADVITITTRVGSRKWYTVPLSILAHALIVGLVVVIPLMATDILPSPPTRLGFVAVAPAPPPPSPPPPPRRTTAPTPSAPPVDTVPLVPATTLGVERLLPPEDPPSLRGIADGLGDEVAGPGLAADVVPGLAPPPPPPRVAPRRVGGAIATPSRLTYVEPRYPAAARAARVEGVVILEAVIDRVGRVTAVRILRSQPLLDAAAEDAVRQWVYTPTRLNGVAVPVILTVTIRFELG